MLKFLAVLALIAVVSAGVVKRDVSHVAKEVVPILRSESDHQPDGSWSFLYEGGDSSFREEKGIVTTHGEDEGTVAISGSYKYIDPEGKTIEVHYTADENGFVPVGGDIPESISKAAKAAADNNASSH